MLKQIGSNADKTTSKAFPNNLFLKRSLFQNALSDVCVYQEYL